MMNHYNEVSPLPRQLSIERPDHNVSIDHDERNTTAAKQLKNYARSRELNRIFIRKTKEAEMSTSPIRVPTDEARAEEDRIVALIKTQEPHLKRAVERRACWVENRNKNAGQSNVYDVKFEFQD